MSDARAERDAALLRLETERARAARADTAETLLRLGTEAPASTASEDFGPVLVRLLSDPQDEVRCAGLALAAHLLPPEEALDVLARHLGDATGRVRLAAAAHLADLELPQARGALAALLEEPLAEVRFEAARGLAALKHPAGLEVLVEALGDPALRFRAAGALVQLGDRRALEPLRAAFHRWFLPPFDKTQLAGALVAFGEEEGINHLLRRAIGSWSMDRGLAVELLGALNVPAGRGLLERLARTPGDSARGAAVRGLGYVPDEGIEALLLGLFDDPTIDDELRLDCAEALVRSKSVRGRQRLEAWQPASAETRSALAALLREGA